MVVLGRAYNNFMSFASFMEESMGGGFMIEPEACDISALAGLGHPV